MFEAVLVQSGSLPSKVWFVGGNQYWTKLENRGFGVSGGSGEAFKRRLKNGIAISSVHIF